jgi:hypothetical protein
MARLRPASLHVHARASVMVPVNLLGLPERLDGVLGLPWALKDEHHVTAADAPHLAERVGAPLDHVARELAQAVEGRRAGPVRVRDELRLVRDGEERTIIMMVSVDGFAALYEELSGRLGAPLAPPPAHVTLYTRPGGGGIGVHDEQMLRDRTRVLTAREAAEVRAAAPALEALLGSGR